MVRDASGAYRVIYLATLPECILVLHARSQDADFANGRLCKDSAPRGCITRGAVSRSACWHFADVRLRNRSLLVLCAGMDMSIAIAVVALVVWGVGAGLLLWLAIAERRLWLIPLGGLFLPVGPVMGYALLLRRLVRGRKE